MSEQKDCMTAYQRLIYEKEHPPVYRLPPPAPDGLQAQIDALRAAVVARNGLLEAISEQIRTSFGAIAEAIGQQHKDFNELANDLVKQQVGLAGQINGVEQGLNALESKFPLLERVLTIESKLKEVTEHPWFVISAAEHRVKQMTGKTDLSEKAKQLKHNQRLGGKQRRRKKR